MLMQEASPGSGRTEEAQEKELDSAKSFFHKEKT